MPRFVFQPGHSINGSPSRLRCSKLLPVLCAAPVLWAAFVLCFFALPAVLFAHAAQQHDQWVRPQKPGDPLTWGRRDGILFGLPSPGGLKGPRGLIRVGLLAPGSDQPQLLNYIAVEPVVAGPGNRFDRMAFSELEMSQLDPGERGKRLSIGPDEESSDMPNAGLLKTFKTREGSVERLSVRINVESFSANGAHVYLIASVDSDNPEELRLAVHAENDSPPLDELTLTATMGNYARLRLVWLKDSVQNSHVLFPKYTEDDFAEGDSYPLSTMLRSNDGDAIVYATSNEHSPHDSPGNATAHWPYLLPKLTQYWRVPAHDVQPDLRVRVNARRVYWASHIPVLGGIAFENFEVRQRYVPGQEFIFGISRQEPWVLDPRLTHLQAGVQQQSRAKREPAK